MNNLFNDNKYYIKYHKKYTIIPTMNVNTYNNIQMDFSSYIGRNCLNVKSDLELIYSGYEIQLLGSNSVVTCDYREDRIRIEYGLGYEVIDIRIG